MNIALQLCIRYDLIVSGHGSVVTDNSGADWFVYHGWIGPQWVTFEFSGLFNKLYFFCIALIFCCHYMCFPFLSKGTTKVLVQLWVLC